MKKGEQEKKHSPKKRKPEVLNKPSVGPVDHKIRKILPFLIVFCFPVLLYLQTLSFHFTSFDDENLINDNVAFLSNFHNAGKVFFTEAFLGHGGHFYRPLQTLSFMVDIKLSGGNNAWMYHLTNIILLGFIACALFQLLRKFLLPLKLALLSTLVFCAHPLFISSVAWLPARGDLMLAVLSLISLLFFIEFLHSQKYSYLFLHWFAFTLALFCKETAAFLPLLFIIYFFTFTSGRRFEKKYLLLLLLYTLSGISWFYLRSGAVGTYSDPDDLVGLHAFVMSIRTIPESLSLFFIPYQIVAFPVFSILKTSIGLLILSLIVLFFFRSRVKTKKEKIFFLSWFLLLLLPTLFFKNIRIDYLDHRFFLPLIGILLFVLYLLPEKWFKNGDIKSPWIMVVVIVVLSSFTFVKTRAYSDPLSFYHEAASAGSYSPLAFYNKGNIVKNKTGDLQEAISCYTRAIELKPDYAEAYNNRANTYAQQGIFDKAEEDYLKAIRLKPDYSDAYYDRGYMYLTLGATDKAVMDLSKAIELTPELDRAFYNRGNAYSRMMQYGKAIEDYTRAIELNPEYARAYNNRGIAYIHISSEEKACNDFNKAAKLGSAEAEGNIAKYCR
jgi:protein O-mannosyl-transferase